MANYLAFDLPVRWSTRMITPREDNETLEPHRRVGLERLRILQLGQSASGQNCQEIGRSRGYARATDRIGNHGQPNLSGSNRTWRSAVQKFHFPSQFDSRPALLKSQ